MNIHFRYFEAPHLPVTFPQCHLCISLYRLIICRMWDLPNGSGPRTSYHFQNNFVSTMVSYICFTTELSVNCGYDTCRGSRVVLKWFLSGSRGRAVCSWRESGPVHCWLDCNASSRRPRASELSGWRERSVFPGNPTQGSNNRWTTATTDGLLAPAPTGTPSLWLPLQILKTYTFVWRFLLFICVPFCGCINKNCHALIHLCI